MGEEHPDRTLHRYFDGDLSPEEVSEVRARLDADPALRAKLEGLREVRALVRETVAPALDELPSEDLWARIEAQVEPAAAKAAAPALVAAGAPAAAKQVAAPEKADGPRLRGIEGGRTAAAPEPARGRRIATIAIAGLALAAAILLLVIQPGETGTVGDPDAIAVVEPPTGPGIAEAAEEDVFRTEVLEVDFGDNSGAIFAVEGEGGERYAVVWLADVQPKQSVE
ncbi:MAG: hypothetical protein M3Y87_12755 [Myxococcota bacterium]|nr:hypothetical protein [Myxococcota bacterium]